MKHLIYAFGNPGRGDDNAAHLIADALLAEDWQEEVTIKHNFQLNLEDVALMADHDRVLFMDASLEADQCRLEKVEPNARQIEFTNHAMAPQYLLSLCALLYGCNPDTYLLHIPGRVFDLSEKMSELTLANMPEAQQLVENWLSERSIQPA